jgi:hypothetical protein
MRDNRTLDNGSQKLCTFFEFEGLKTTTQSVEEDETGRIVLLNSVSVRLLNGLRGTKKGPNLLPNLNQFCICEHSLQCP